MCDYMKMVASAAAFIAIVGLAVLLEDTSKTYRVVEDDDGLGLWLEKDNEQRT